MNKVFLSGYLAQDPIGGTTQKGIDYSIITVACDDVENYKSTFFIKCKAFGNVAKYINSKMLKGSLVTIDGKIVNRKYTNNNNQIIKVTEIVINNIKGYTKKTKTDTNLNDINNIIESFEEEFPTGVYEIDEIINK